MPVSTETFAYVSDLVRKKSAIQLAPGKEYLVESRLLPLARLAGLQGADAVNTYVTQVRQANNVTASVAMVEALTTNETSWFRDTTPFAALRDAVLPAVRAAHTGPLRIWSAACSTGQEPYSIAMALLDAGEHHFSVLATDLSTSVLDRARAGQYSQLEMNRGLPATMLVRYFTRSGPAWQAAECLRTKVTFRQHNLLDPPPAGPFDVVFLRNVLIYFDAATKQDILARLRRQVRPGGHLVLGAAETVMGTDPHWDRVQSARGSVYRLRGGCS